MKFNIKNFPVTCPIIDLASLPDNSLKSFVMFSPSLVSEYLNRTIVDSSQNEIRSISSDIDLLIRMRNGQKIDTAVAEQLLDRMSSGLDDSLKAIFDNASDEDILDSVRSKYIQTPAQLEAYLKSLDSRLVDMSSQDIQDTIDTSDVQSGQPEKSIADSSTD